MNTLDFKIDYNNPHKYLAQGEQTQFIFSEKQIEIIKKQIGPIETSKDLLNLVRFIETNRKGDVNQYSDIKFKRTAKQVFDSKVYTGCTDFAIVFAAIARQLGLPTVCVEAVSVDGIIEEDGNAYYDSHHTCEVFICNKWVLVDPANGSVNGLDYDYKNPLVQYRSGKQGRVFFKGLDLFEAGIKSAQDMIDLIRNLVKSNIKE